MTLRHFVKPIALIAGAFVLVSCAGDLGPSSVAPAGYEYNQAIAKTKDEQLLLNLVRLRYRDTSVFMDVGAVTSQQSYSANVSADAGFPFSRFSDGAGSAGSGVEYSLTPTITYQPQKGAEFATKLLSPIGADTIILMANSGWSIERLLACCVEKFGSLSNAPSASGPTPPELPNNADFRELSNLLRKLQRSERFYVEQLTDGAAGAIKLGLVIDAEGLEECQKLQIHFGGTNCQWNIYLSDIKHSGSSNQVYAQTRTVLGALYALSQGVNVPAIHAEEGLVTQSTVLSGDTPDWETFLSGQFQVQSSKQKPEAAAVKIFYRDHWFWIADNDLESKTTFNLLDFLIALKSVSNEKQSPLLLLSAGR